MAVANTKKGNFPFDEADPAGIVLKAVPTSWVNQYNLTHSTLPKSPRLLLPDLENIERVMNKKRAELAKGQGQGKGWYSLGWCQAQPQEKGAYGLKRASP
jgi:hypothetical protein